MMEEDGEKGEKQKLAVHSNDDETKGKKIKATTSAKEAMCERGEKMIETKMIYESKLWIEFNVKEGVECSNV
eukprot:11321815-Ditylum_brightwellii.AAC.1